MSTYIDGAGVLRYGPPGGTYPPGPPVDLSAALEAERRRYPTPPVAVSTREVVAGILRDHGVGRLRAWVITRALARAQLLAPDQMRPGWWWS